LPCVLLSYLLFSKEIACFAISFGSALSGFDGLSFPPCLRLSFASCCLLACWEKERESEREDEDVGTGDIDGADLCGPVLGTTLLPVLGVVPFPTIFVSESDAGVGKSAGGGAAAAAAATTTGVDNGERAGERVGVGCLA